MANGTITRFPGETDVEFQFRQQAQGKALAFAQQVPGRTTPLPQTFDAAQLDQPSQVDLPTPETPIDTVSPFISSLEPAQQSIQQQINQAFQSVQAANAAAAQPIQEERTGLTARLQERLGALTGRATRQQEIEQQLEIPQNIKQLQEVNLQLAQRKGEFEKAIAAIPGQGRGVTTSIVAGQQARARRQAAVELGAQASVAQALQGNIALAQQTADRTVAVEFEGIEQEIQGIQLMLDLNRENFTRVEKRRAEQVELVLAERKRLLSEAKEERRNILNFAAQAAQNGAPNDIVNRITQARSIDQALEIAGPELRDPLKALQLQQARLNIQKTIGQIVGSSAATASGAGGTGVVSTDGEPVSQEVQDWVTNINNGIANFSSVPKALKGAVNSALASTPLKADDSAQLKVKERIALIDSILVSPGLSGAVGPTRFARIRPIAALTGATAEFIGGVQQLVSQETLQSLIDLKKGGGTLGALSDQERVMLQTAATKIGNWAVTNKEGQIVAYKVSEKTFKNELNRIKSLAQKAVVSASENLGPEPQVMNDGTAWVQNPDGSFTQIN